MSFTVTTFTIDFEFASSFAFGDFFAFFKAFGGVFMVRISQGPDITSIYLSSPAESRPQRWDRQSCLCSREARLCVSSGLLIISGHNPIRIVIPPALRHEGSEPAAADDEGSASILRWRRQSCLCFSIALAPLSPPE